MKKRKKCKDVEPTKGSKSKESKTSLSKGTKSQPKSSGKSTQAKETVFEATDTKMPQNQGSDMGQTDDRPDIEAAKSCDWFKKPKEPPTPDPEWNATKTIDFKPPQKWISGIANATKPPLTFDELMHTPIDFSAMLQTVNDHIDWTNPEGHQYPFNLSKPLPLIEVQGLQVVLADYFINNDLEYLKGGSLSRKYTTSTTKIKATKYDNIQGIEDMVLTLWSPVEVAYDRYALWWYDYGYLEEIMVRRKDQSLHKFKEGDFLNLNLRDIKDMLLLLVHKNISNIERDVIFDLNVALQMPETFRSNISDMTPYSPYNNPQGTIYLDKFNRNGLMRANELYKFCDGTLTSVRTAIDIQLYERQLLRNLEKFIGGREYGEDFRLLERIVAFGRYRDAFSVIYLVIDSLKKMTPKKRTTRASPATTTTTTTPITNAQLKALIDQGVADALASRDADRSMNGDDVFQKL
ncbi:hypothetical protein Tco_1504122 [Tanacetum coccineum]